MDKYPKTLHVPYELYLECEIKRLKVTLHVFQLDEARGVDVVPVDKGARCHHTADSRRRINGDY